MCEGPDFPVRDRKVTAHPKGMQSETGYGGQQIRAEKDASDTDPDTKPASRSSSSRRVAKQERARQQALIISPFLFPLSALSHTRRAGADLTLCTDGGLTALDWARGYAWDEVCAAPCGRVSDTDTKTQADTWTSSGRQTDRLHRVPGVWACVRHGHGDTD
jgi:hypothetical protein